MTSGRGPEDLEVEQDLDFQRREWKAQRAGRIGLTLLLAAALAGLLGNGPLANSVAGDEGVFWVEYQRFGRLEASQELRVHLGPALVEGGRAVVWLSRELVERLDIDAVTPDPEATRVHADRVAYEFLVGEPTDDVAITFTLRPEHWGPTSGAVGVEGGPAVRVNQLVYP